MPRARASSNFSDRARARSGGTYYVVLMGALTSRCRSQKKQQNATNASTVPHASTSGTLSAGPGARASTSTSQPSHLDRLPTDVTVSHVLPFLDAADVLELRRTSAEYGRLASLDAVGRARLPARARALVSRVQLPLLSRANQCAPIFRPNVRLSLPRARPS